jgi:predicted deacylase
VKHRFAASAVATEFGVLLTSPLTGFFLPAIAPGTRVTRGTLLGVVLVVANNHLVVAPDVDGIVTVIDERPHAIDRCHTLAIVEVSRE